MPKRDFLAITDFSRDETIKLLDLARRMKKGAYRETPLAGKSLAMIFAKSSTRTRVSFEVGTYQLGGQALLNGQGDIGESLFDAGTGGAGIHAVLSDLERESDALFKARAVKPSLNAAVAEFKAAKKKSRDEVRLPGTAGRADHSPQRGTALLPTTC